MNVRVAQRLLQSLTPVGQTFHEYGGHYTEIDLFLRVIGLFYWRGAPPARTGRTPSPGSEPCGILMQFRMAPPEYASNLATAPGCGHQYQS